MIAVDTSVVVAGFASWHEGHTASRKSLARRPRVPAHVLVETFSVLTRLPPPHRAPADLVAQFLARRFPDVPLVLPEDAYDSFIGEAATAGLTGGAVYDALIAATARHSGAKLLTRDRRASTVYERIGVRYELVG